MSERDRLVEVARQAASDYSDYIEKKLYGEGIPKVSELFPEVMTFPEFLTDHLIANNVTIPPVTVGQTIYLIRKPIDRPAWIDECTVAQVQVNYSSDGKVITFSTYNFAATESEIGETVFLTREEAEQALKERSKDNDNTRL